MLIMHNYEDKKAFVSFVTFAITRKLNQRGLKLTKLAQDSISFVNYSHP